ncbi:MAG TPA: hypothetical protein VMH81_10405 [Bryobacteraceae bacterium]|nr:hypothetical protein [Bryobacteraceae bacterium]
MFDDSCHALGPNQEGELVLSGPQVALGYFQDGPRTSARFPVIDGHTGKSPESIITWAASTTR